MVRTFVSCFLYQHSNNKLQETNMKNKLTSHSIMDSSANRQHRTRSLKYNFTIYKTTSFIGPTNHGILSKSYFTTTLHSKQNKHKLLTYINSTLPHKSQVPAGKTTTASRKYKKNGNIVHITFKVSQGTHIRVFIERPPHKD